MSKCHHPIRFSNALQFISDLITNTEYQVRLNSFKHKRCSVTEENEKATIGKLYWSGFMRQNGQRLNLVRTQQFRLDTNKWCKYAAFYDMYD